MSLEHVARRLCLAVVVQFGAHSTCTKHTLEVPAVFLSTPGLRNIPLV